MTPRRFTLALLLGEIMNDHTQSLVDKLRARGLLTQEQLFTAGLDCLDFIVTTLDAGQEIGVRSPGGEWVRQQIIIPGLTTE